LSSARYYIKLEDVNIAKGYHPISFKNITIQNKQLADIISTPMESLESGL